MGSYIGAMVSAFVWVSIFVATTGFGVLNWRLWVLALPFCFFNGIAWAAMWER